MTNEWTALGVLPNINMEASCFGGEYLAVVGENDDRYDSAVANGTDLDIFLSKFESAHGVRLRPSLLVK
ncbi:hypothetical protein [Rhizobium ruizarguesonis]|uniref:hypothetical protein n=1 Tax=Rhizobium ruizarguesonis TaxID=2081791 RepID=UPI001FEE6B0E|nr:hypothetical protein [Rhizobium ruizarguesonis]